MDSEDQLSFTDRMAMAALGGVFGAGIGLVMAVVHMLAFTSETSINGKFVLSGAAIGSVLGFFCWNLIMSAIEAAIHFTFGLFSIAVEADLRTESDLPGRLKGAFWSGAIVGVGFLVWWEFM